MTMTLKAFTEFGGIFFVAAFVFFGFLIGNLRNRLQKVEAELEGVTKNQKPIGI